MPSITYWNRLEPRARSGDLTTSLAARVRDPAWFLARQWQMGEFRGEDAGTPAYVDVNAMVTRVVGWRATAASETQQLGDGEPIEPFALSEPFSSTDLSTAIDLGLWFERLLAEASLASLLSHWRAAFPIEAAAGDDPGTARLRSLWKGRAIDGVALYLAAKQEAEPPPAPPPGVPETVPSGDWAAASTVVQGFADFVGESDILFGAPGTSDPPAWQPERLDYSLQAFVAEPNTGELEIETDLAFLPWAGTEGCSVTVGAGASYTVACAYEGSSPPDESVTVTISAGTYSAVDLVTAMNSQLNAIGDCHVDWRWDNSARRGHFGIDVQIFHNHEGTWTLTTPNANGDAFLKKLGFSAPETSYPRTIVAAAIGVGLKWDLYPESDDIVRIPAGSYAPNVLATLIQDQLDNVTLGGASWTFQWVAGAPPLRANMDAIGGGAWSFANYPTYGVIGFTSRFGYDVETDDGGVYGLADGVAKQGDNDVDVTTSGGATMKVLRAEPDAEGELEWFAFDGTTETPPGDLPSPSVEVVNQTLMPGHVRFRGMPNARFWDFEDGRVDFGGLRPDRRDLLSMVLMDFMLVHGNDWFVIPFEQAFGTRCRISELTVVDVFGIETLVPRAEDVEISAAPGKRWSMFSTKTSNGVSAALLLPATVAAGVIDGEVVEDVRFIRDETANLAWAIEHSTESRLGRPWLGHERNTASSSSAEILGSVPLRYRLQTTVPSNWIPFQPVQLPEEVETLLQRSTLLGPEGLLNPQASGKVLNPEGYGSAYRIREEEIPREGRRVSRLPRWARDVDGRGHLWMSRKRAIGRGEGWSGLRFDWAAPAKVSTMTWDALPGWDDSNWA